jgi:hypothetical protein
MIKVRIGGFGLVVGYIEQYRIVNRSNCSSIANSHTLQFTIAHVKFYQPAVSSPVSFASVLTSSPNFQPCRFKTLSEVEVEVTLRLTVSQYVRVRVILRLTVIQTVCLGVEHTLWTIDQILLEVEVTLRLIVSQSVFLGIEHTLWDLRPDITSCWNVAV